MARTHPLLLAGLLAGAALWGATMSAGCSTPVQRRVYATAEPRSQGAAWEVVLPGGESAPDVVAGPEAGRRDMVLADTAGSDLPDDAWPAPYLPDLNYTQRLTLPDHRTQIFYIGRYPGTYYPRYGPGYWGHGRATPWW